jgi:hypothetical protein
MKNVQFAFGGILVFAGVLFVIYSLLQGTPIPSFTTETDTPIPILTSQSDASDTNTPTPEPTDTPTNTPAVEIPNDTPTPPEVTTQNEAATSTSTLSSEPSDTPLPQPSPPTNTPTPEPPANTQVTTDDAPQPATPTNTPQLATNVPVTIVDTSTPTLTPIPTLPSISQQPAVTLGISQPDEYTPNTNDWLLRWKPWTPSADVPAGWFYLVSFSKQGNSNEVFLTRKVLSTEACNDNQGWCVYSIDIVDDLPADERSCYPYWDVVVMIDANSVSCPPERLWGDMCRLTKFPAEQQALGTSRPGSCPGGSSSGGGSQGGRGDPDNW